MLAKLRESGLTANDARALGFEPKTEEQSASLKLSRAGEGFRLLYYDPITGEEWATWRYRFFETVQQSGFLKGVKLNKYEQAHGTPVRAYFPRLPGCDWNIGINESGLADAALRSPAIAVEQLQFREAKQLARKVRLLFGALPRHLIVVAQDGG
jgi:hypothetical protein